MDAETSYDLRENIAVFCIAILLAEIYGSIDSNIYHRIKRYKAKKEKETSSGGNQKRSVSK